MGMRSRLCLEVVEARLIRGDVGNITRIGALAVLDAHGLLDAAHREPEELVDAAHPSGIPASQIVVHRHHVDALARLRIPGNRWDCGKGLPLTCLHLSNLFTCESQCTLELHLEHFYS